MSGLGVRVKGYGLMRLLGFRYLSLTSLFDPYAWRCIGSCVCLGLATLNPKLGLIVASNLGCGGGRVDRFLTASKGLGSSSFLVVGTHESLKRGHLGLYGFRA